MLILVDENIPLRTVRELRAGGHDVLDLRESPRRGLPDDAIWDVAQAEQRLLVTTDKGFARHRDETHAGILVVRLRQPNRERIHARVMAAISHFAPPAWPGLTVVLRDAVQSVRRARS